MRTKARRHAGGGLVRADRAFCGRQTSNVKGYLHAARQLAAPMIAQLEWIGGSCEADVREHDDIAGPEVMVPAPQAIEDCRASITMRVQTRSLRLVQFTACVAADTLLKRNSTGA